MNTEVLDVVGMYGQYMLMIAALAAVVAMILAVLSRENQSLKVAGRLALVFAVAIVGAVELGVFTLGPV